MSANGRKRPATSAASCASLRKVHVQRRAQLHSSDLDSCGPQPLERRCRILVLDGEVAAVEAEPDVILEVAPRLVRIDAERRREHQGANREQPLLEEHDRLLGVLEDAVGLGLDVEMDEGSMLAPDSHERYRRRARRSASSSPTSQVRRRPPRPCRRAARSRRHRRDPRAGAPAGSGSSRACSRRARRHASPARRRWP